MNGQVLSLLIFLWCLAVVIKVAGVLSRREPYEFTWWDGGLMLNGKAMGRAGSAWFGVFALALGGFSARLLVLWSQL
jgi:hypothetical protein